MGEVIKVAGVDFSVDVDPLTVDPKLLLMLAHNECEEEEDHILFVFPATIADTRRKEFSTCLGESILRLFLHVSPVRRW